MPHIAKNWHALYQMNNTSQHSFLDICHFGEQRK